MEKSHAWSVVQPCCRENFALLKKVVEKFHLEVDFFQIHELLVPGPKSLPKDRESLMDGRG